MPSTSNSYIFELWYSAVCEHWIIIIRIQNPHVLFPKRLFDNWQQLMSSPIERSQQHTAPLSADDFYSISLSVRDNRPISQTQFSFTFNCSLSTNNIIRRLEIINHSTRCTSLDFIEEYSQFCCHLARWILNWIQINMFVTANRLFSHV